MANTLRYLAAVVLTAVFLMFALQNLQVAEVNVLAWTIETSVSLIVLVPLAGGLLLARITMLVTRSPGRRAGNLPSRAERGTPEHRQRADNGPSAEPSPDTTDAP